MSEHRQCSFGDITTSLKDGHKNTQEYGEAIPLSSSSYLFKNTQIYSPSQQNAYAQPLEQQNEILLSNKTSQNFNEEYVQRVLNQVLANTNPVEEYQASYQGAPVSFSSSYAKPKQDENSKMMFGNDITDKPQFTPYATSTWQNDDRSFLLNHQIQIQTNNYPQDLLHVPKQIENVLNQSTKYSPRDYNSTEIKGNTLFTAPSSSINLTATNPGQIIEQTQLLNGSVGQQQSQINQFSNDFLTKQYQYQSSNIGESQSPYQISNSSGQYYTPQKTQIEDFSIDSSSQKQHPSQVNNNIKPGASLSESLYPSLASVQVPYKNAMINTPVYSGQTGLSVSSQVNNSYKSTSPITNNSILRETDKHSTNQFDKSQGLSYLKETRLENEKCSTNGVCQECLILKQRIEYLEHHALKDVKNDSHAEKEYVKCIEEQKKELESSKGLGGKSSNLGNQVEDQAQTTIQRLKQVSSAYDKLYKEYSVLSANLADQGQRLKEKEKEIAEFKAKRDAERKKEKSKYDDVLGKLNSHESKQEQLKKDFERKSATIIRELLNKDIKIRELQGKLHPRGSEKYEKDRSPLNRLLQEEKQVGEDYHNTDKSRSKSPMSDKKQIDSTAQYWQKLMDSSNITQQVAQANSLEQSSISNKQNSPQRLEQLSVNCLAVSANHSNLKSSIQVSKEIQLKKELRFVIEQVIEILANLIVSELREKGKTSDLQLNEEKIVKEADKQLKSILMKLKETAIQSSMAECYNILEAIVSCTGSVSSQNQKKSGSKNSIQYLSDDKRKNSQVNDSRKNNGNLNSTSPAASSQAQDEVKRKLFGNTSNSINGSNQVTPNKQLQNTASNQSSRRITIAGQIPQSLHETILTNHMELSPRGYLHQQATSPSSKLTDALKEIKKKSLSPQTKSNGKRSQKFSNYFSKQTIKRPSVSPKKGQDSSDEINTAQNLSAIMLH